MERALDPGRLGDHIDRLYRAAWALCGSREDAEDLVQETFVRVLARPRFLRKEDDVGYLLGAAQHAPVAHTHGESPRTDGAAAGRARLRRRPEREHAGDCARGEQGLRGD